MDHVEANRRFAAEQYLLGEMSEAEREEFEQHFFECPECAEALETGALLVEDAKAVLREQPRAVVPQRKKINFAWGGGWGFAPAAAFAGWTLALVLAAAQFVHSPATSNLVIAPAVSVRAARSGEGLTFSKRTGMMALTIPHEWEITYSRYQGEIERAGDQRVIYKAETPATAEALSVAVRLEDFRTGSYVLRIYGIPAGSAEKTPVAQVPFTLTE